MEIHARGRLSKKVTVAMSASSEVLGALRGKTHALRGRRVRVPAPGGSTGRRAGELPHRLNGPDTSTVLDMMGYIEVAGLRTWHEVSGEGDPLVLLHGGFAGASSFFAQTPALVEAGYRVHVPERRGHAHTPDVEGPLSYSVMADDTVAYLEQEVGAATS